MQPKFWMPNVKKVSTDEVLEQLNHLNPLQKKDLKEVMKDKSCLIEHWVFAHTKSLH